MALSKNPKPINGIALWSATVVVKKTQEWQIRKEKTINYTPNPKFNYFILYTGTCSYKAKTKKN